MGEVHWDVTHRDAAERGSGVSQVCLLSQPAEPAKARGAKQSDPKSKPGPATK